MAARNGVQRTLGELSAHLADISRQQEEHKAAIITLGDRFEHALERHVDDDRKDFDEVDQRLQKIEKRQNRMIGQVAGASLLFGGATGIIVQVVLHYFRRL